MAMSVDTREFDEAIRNLSRESTRTDAEMVTYNAVSMVKSLKWNAPRDTGATRAGFWPAWEALGIAGSPDRKRMIPFRRGRKKTSRQYVPAGKVVDTRDVKNDPGFEFILQTHYVDKTGRKVYYPYILNAQVGWWQWGIDEATAKMEKAYERLLRKHSAR